MAVDTRAALAKLTSGQTLTAEEKAALNIGPAVTPVTTTPVATVTPRSAGVGIDPTATDTTVTTSATVGTATSNLDKVRAAQAAQAAADAKLKEDSKPADFANPPAGSYYQWHVFAGGGGQWRLINASGFGGSSANGNAGTGGSNTGTGTGTGSTGTGTGNVTTGLSGLTTSQLAVTSALDEFRSVLGSVGLADLANQMDTWIKENRQPAEIKTLVRTSQSYKDRFPGMADLSAKNVAITEGDYINLERGYTEVLNAYGVDTSVFGSRKALGSYISNQINAREFEERVNDAAVRVTQNSDVLAALSMYHGVDKSTAIAYLLDPKLGMDLVRKQVRGAEIGAAAIGAGFDQFGQDRASTGANLAESYVTQIGTEDLTTLKKEFGQAAILAQTQGRLASIEGQAYNSDQAIQAAVVGNQQAGLESQRRAAREAARFGGQGSYITRESTAGLI